MHLIPGIGAGDFDLEPIAQMLAVREGDFETIKPGWSPSCLLRWSGDLDVGSFPTTACRSTAHYNFAMFRFTEDIDDEDVRNGKAGSSHLMFKG